MAVASHHHISSIGCGRKKSSLRRRCVTMVKQQKTRFYILGRCISMLICWDAHDLSD